MQAIIRVGSGLPIRTNVRITFNILPCAFRGLIPATPDASFLPSPIGQILYLCPMGQKKLIRFAAIKTFPMSSNTPKTCRENGRICSKMIIPSLLSWPAERENTRLDWQKCTPAGIFLGVDLKGNRIYIGAKNCLQENITNAAFLRTQIDRLPTYFRPGEVEEIWLTFPIPSCGNRRPAKGSLIPNSSGFISRSSSPRAHPPKTDSPVLYNFTRLVIDMYGLSSWKARTTSMPALSRKS